jgi:heparan-alpha-glucosaminide N-acetyltransferase
MANSISDSTATTRIASVDVYRGMVMFLMLAEILHLSDLKKLVTSEGWLAKGADWIAFHTSHVAWRGCSLHDMIQPSFSFLVGTAMAFSIVARASKGQTRGSMFWHAVFRSVVLVFLGVFLRSLGKPATNFTFDDTLTQIGLGYPGCPYAD